MLLDFGSLTIALLIVFCFAVVPKTPSYLLLMFLIFYNIVCWWHIESEENSNVYLTSVPIFFSKKSIDVELIEDYDYWINISLGVLIIIIRFLETI